MIEIMSIYHIFIYALCKTDDTKYKLCQYTFTAMTLQCHKISLLCTSFSLAQARY